MHAWLAAALFLREATHWLRTSSYFDACLLCSITIRTKSNAPIADIEHDAEASQQPHAREAAAVHARLHRVVVVREIHALRAHAVPPQPHVAELRALHAMIQGDSPCAMARSWWRCRIWRWCSTGSDPHTRPRALERSPARRLIKQL